jgi:hypothetical protein
MADTESGLNETSLRHRLKRETAAVHQHLEGQLGLLDPSLDVHRQALTRKEKERSARIDV